jgi:hypothetical protein
MYETLPLKQKAVFEDMLDCLSKIEENLSNLQVQNNNGGLPDSIDVAEVNRWTEETQRKRLAKSRDAFQESNQI